MEERIQLLSEFFRLYADRFNRGLNEDPDLEGAAGSFADYFIGASPLGVMCGKNDDDFIAALRRGFEYYTSLGITAMDIVSIQTTILDDFHEMTRIGWRSGYTNKDNTAGSIEFDNIYFTQTIEKESKIFAYITGDEQAAMKKHRLI